MAPRLLNKLVILAKIETVEGTDAAPTGATNALQMTNVTLTPLAGDQAARNLMLPYLGNQGVQLTGSYMQIKGDIEIAGSGEAGTPPLYGPLLRACSFAETITAATKVEYDFVSEGFESASMYFNQDGVNHIALGARGTLSLDLTPKQIPHYTFTMTGMLGTIADTALPTVDLSGFIKPAVVSKANTTLSLFGLNAIAESLSLDLGIDVQPRFLIGSENIQITDRQVSGTAVLEAHALAEKDWFAIAQARTRGALSAVHGTVAGNIVKFDEPQVEIGRPTQGQTQKIVNYSVPLMLCPDAGDDELKITVM